MESLTWKVTATGDFKAVGLDRTYVISNAGNKGFNLHVDGKLLTTTSTTRLAKKAAQRDNQRGF